MVWNPATPGHPRHVKKQAPPKSVWNSHWRPFRENTVPALGNQRFGLNSGWGLHKPQPAHFPDFPDRHEGNKPQPAHFLDFLDRHGANKPQSAHFQDSSCPHGISQNCIPWGLQAQAETVVSGCLAVLVFERQLRTKQDFCFFEDFDVAKSCKPYEALCPN